MPTHYRKAHSRTVNGKRVAVADSHPHHEAGRPPVDVTARQVVGLTITAAAASVYLLTAVLNLAGAILTVATALVLLLAAGKRRGAHRRLGFSSPARARKRTSRARRAGRVVVRRVKRAHKARKRRRGKNGKRLSGFGDRARGAVHRATAPRVVAAAHRDERGQWHDGDRDGKHGTRVDEPAAAAIPEPATPTLDDAPLEQIEAGR